MGTPISGVWDDRCCIYGELVAYKDEILRVAHPTVTYSSREGIAQALLLAGHSNKANHCVRGLLYLLAKLNSNESLRQYLLSFLSSSRLPSAAKPTRDEWHEYLVLRVTECWKWWPRRWHQADVQY